MALTLAGVSGPGCHGIAGAVCSTARWEYDAVGNVLTERLAWGSGAAQGEVTRSHTYDRVQRVETRTDELGKSWRYAYDKGSKLLSETAPLGRVTTWAYDVGRVLTETDPLGHRVRNEYDRHGERVLFEDPNLNVTHYGRDKAGRLVEVTDPLGHASGFGYDQGGNRTQVIDPRGKVQTAEYDALGRPVRLTTPPAVATHSCSPTCLTDEVARTATASYTLDGLKQTETDYNGLTRSYSYDTARRLKGVDYGDGTPDVGYAWDKRGNRVRLTENGALTAEYAWDELSRLLSETRGGSVLRYRYDRRDQVGMTYPDGKTLTQTFDAGGRLEHLDDWRGPTSGRTSYRYDEAHRKVGMSLPNGATTDWAWDAGDRLTRVEHRAPSGGLLSWHAWTYDNVGNRLSQTDYDPARGGPPPPTGTPGPIPPSRAGPIPGVAVPDPLPPSRAAGPDRPGVIDPLPPSRPTPPSVPAETTQTFAYDRANRLIGETPRVGLAPTTWEYDPAGNRTRMTVGSDVTQYEYDDDNRLKYAARGGTTTSFKYDQNGSTIEKALGGDVTAYRYDGARRLGEVTRNGSSLASFGYDGDGARTSKTAGGVTTSYVNDTRSLTQVLQETKAGNTIAYVTGVAQHDPSQATEPARWAYFHGDAQNNRLLTDGAAAVSHRGEYDPFGNVRDESGPARSEFGYADEQRDAETGLVNLRARYYEPGLGRFLSRDAFGGLDADPQGWNRYSYVENNPITGTDPSGHYGRGLPKAQVRALGRDFAAGRFSEQNLSLIRRLTKDQYRWATATLVP